MQIMKHVIVQKLMWSNTLRKFASYMNPYKEYVQQKIEEYMNLEENLLLF